MKLGYLILDRIKLCPAESHYRLLTEEKIKWIMEKTDETEDIRKLEESIGCGNSIEVLIQELHNEYKLIDVALSTRRSPRNKALGARTRFEA